ncbi:DUF2975 domain-containing protein [Flavobacterium sp. UBA6135]|uniref:DUF2975 domain-containing protein n=1 Tax=Flavobacterium sp. UBA6135 TaxID=1946553 RepID=UPI0025BD56BA|nr:DUF2975 domain-containing protein [Flavobacterium sp. UBA6135]
MRKLNILKAIVDFIWIMSLFALPLIIVFFVFIIFSNETIDIPLKINDLEIDTSIGQSKYLLPVALMHFGLFIYALYFFRKLLENFKKLIIFEVENAKLLNKIGQLIMINAVVYALLTFALQLLIGKLTIDIGYGPFLYVLALGLFFSVLSEVFLMGKKLKEENELTI